MRWFLVVFALGIAGGGCETTSGTSTTGPGESGEGLPEEEAGEEIRQNTGFATIRVQKLGSLHGSNDKFFAVSALPVLEISRYVVTLKALLESFTKHL